MSNASQNRAAKRNARAKAKRISGNKARSAPKAVAARETKRLVRKLGGHHMEFESVLENAVRNINKGGKPLETTINSPTEMVEGLKRNIGEVFKFFSYVVLLKNMVEKQIIEHTLVIDLKPIALDLIHIDSRVSRLIPLLGANEEEAVVTECLDIATTIQNYADELYAEITRAEPHSLVIEETIDSLGTEVEGEMSYAERSAKVLNALAYNYLATIQTEVIAAEPAPEQQEEPVAEQVETAN